MSAGSSRSGKAFLVLLLATVAMSSATVLKARIPDGDNYWQVATGRYIVENMELPRTNPFVIHDGFGIVVQQWAFDIAIYLLYGHFGASGLLAFGMLNLAVLCLSLYRFAGRFSDDAESRLTAAALAGAVLVLNLSMTRPSVITLVMMLHFMCTLEADRKRPSWTIAIYIIVQTIAMARWPSGHAS